MGRSNEDVSFTLWCIFLMIVGMIMPAMEALSVDYYKLTCPNITGIVKDAMNQAYEFDPVNVPALLRLHAHDCFVNSADGSVLIDPIPGKAKVEKQYPPNLSLFGFEAVENAKALVEEQCPLTVSCADILALLAQFAVELAGGPIYNTPLGRRDSRRSLYTDAKKQIPLPDMTMQQLIANFKTKNLTQDDLVVLTGAHTVGFLHCNSFSNRIYNYNKTFPYDPTMDPTMVDGLHQVCSPHPDPNIVQPLDICTISQFDNCFYQNLYFAEGLLHSDQLLFNHPNTTNLTMALGATNDSSLFFELFVASMLKFNSFGVLEGKKGEIRITCNATR